ncbi:mitochondrial-processing peptidase subunit alpha-like [Artemia franciscana]
MRQNVKRLVRSCLNQYQTRQCSSKVQRDSPFPTSDIKLNSDLCLKTSLSEPVVGLPPAIFSTPDSSASESRITTLSNGLRVASEKQFGNFCTVGVVIDAGSRYEVAYPSGVSHFLEKLAFSSSKSYGDREKILHSLEKHGGICDCQSTKDTFIYAASAESNGLNDVIRLIADVVLRPNITEEEVEFARQVVSYELENLNIQPNQDPILLELIHAAAWRDNTLGLPKLCPPENIDKINRHTLFTFLRSHFTPERIVLAGVGVEHEALVEAAQKYFVEEKPIWEENQSLGSRLEVDPSIAQYTGGLITQEKDLSDVSLGPTPMPELAHFVLGLESSSHRDDDFIAYCVLNMLMGGGGSFSAGGPGKGMYTRLYTQVLNRYHWMHNATAYNHAYGDSGVFCIHGASHPSQIADVASVITSQFVGMSRNLDVVDFERAKKQLQSMLLMNLEARPVVFEDLGRQVLFTGIRKRPEEFIQKIGAITKEDIYRVAKRLLASKPAIAALGNLKNLPEHRAIEEALLSKDGKISRRSRFTLF